MNDSNPQGFVEFGRMPESDPSGRSRRREWLALAGLAALALTAGVLSPILWKPVLDSREISVTARLALLRGAVAQYALQHGAFPGQNGSGELLRQLLGKTNAEGEVGEGAEHVYGPYLRDEQIPINPIVYRCDVRIVDDVPAVPQGGEAWIYDPATGEVRANATGTNGRGVRWFDF